jgi:hypothetical protein
MESWLVVANNAATDISTKALPPSATGKTFFVSA